MYTAVDRNKLDRVTILPDFFFLFLLQRLGLLLMYIYTPACIYNIIIHILHYMYFLVMRSTTSFPVGASETRLLSKGILCKTVILQLRSKNHRTLIYSI